MSARHREGNGPTPAVILGLYPASVPVARSLGRKGIPVYGLDAGEGTVAARSRYLTRVTVPKRDDQLVEFLIEFSRKLKSKFVVMPFSDRYVMFLAKHHDVLADACFFPMRDPQRTADLVGKIESDRLLTRLGIAHPRTLWLRRGVTRCSDAGSLSYPCLLKPNLHDSWQSSSLFRAAIGSQQRVLLVEDRRTLEECIRVLCLLDDTLIQEYVPGPSEDLFYYVGYRDRSGNTLLSFVGSKIRTLPDCLGSETLLRSVNRPDILRYGKTILEALDYHGPAGIDLKYDRRDNTMKVIEINCRIGLSDCYLAGYGMDLPWIYYRESQGLDAPVHEGYPAGIVWHDLLRDLEWLHDYRKQMRLSWSDWLSTFRARGSEALFDWSDPLPFLHAAMPLVSRVFRKVFSRRTATHAEALKKQTRAPASCKDARDSAGPTDGPSPHRGITDWVLEAVTGAGSGKPDRDIGRAIAKELRIQGFDREQTCKVLTYGWNAPAHRPLPPAELAVLVEEVYSDSLAG